MPNSYCKTLGAFFRLVGVDTMNLCIYAFFKMVYESFCRNPFSITTKFFMRNFAKLAVIVFVTYLLQENKINTEKFERLKIF